MLRIFFCSGLRTAPPDESRRAFEAARLRLLVVLRPLLAAFLLGRLVAYSLYVSLATAAAAGLGGLLVDALRSPIGIAIQLLMLAGLAALLRIDWATRLRHRAANGHP